jgi:hypothetical protein
MKFNSLMRILIVIIIIIVILGGVIIIIVIPKPVCTVCTLNTIKYLGIAEVILGVVALGLTNKLRQIQR